ncbi:MAG TPA: hypothetical protein VKA49_20600 [Flavitalea sp.]|nr:hypothetical protein [Flavitalea sp.]
MTKNISSNAQRKVGDPLQNLPDNIEILTRFGERADIAPDNKRIAFMAKTFGDAMVIDLQTREITCLTCGIPAAAFLRVMHLSNGDYLLVGPDHFENAQISKNASELWYLPKKNGSRPVKLDVKISEGLAISKKQLKIAYTQVDSIPDITTRIIIADLELIGSSPKIINQKVVLESRDKSCRLEAQDFFDGDKELTYFCYVPNGAFEVMGLNLANGISTNFSLKPGHFNEPEGIFPDGEYTAVESDWQCTWLGGVTGSSNIDIWKLKLNGSGNDFVRLTHFNDYEGAKAANPVVSGDGKLMAFQSARADDPPGTGRGLLIYWFKNKKQKGTKKIQSKN